MNMNIITDNKKIHWSWLSLGVTPGTNVLAPYYWALPLSLVLSRHAGIKSILIAFVDVFILFTLY
jgi:hypothetical protein